MSANGVEGEKGEDVKQQPKRLNSYSAAAAQSKPAPPAEEKKSDDGSLSRSGSKKSTNSSSEGGKKKTNSVSDAAKRGRDRVKSGNYNKNNDGGGDRRNSWRNNGQQTKSKSFDRNRPLSSTGRSFEDERGEKKERLRSTNSAGKSSRHHTSNSANSNGESFDYGDDFDLDEPFSDSDEDSPFHREVAKPALQIPRGRIRTLSGTVPPIDSPFHREVAKPALQIPRGRIRTLSGTVPPIGYSPLWGGPTMCLACLEFFNLPDDISKFTEHLLKEHKIVVEEMELIVDPKRYIEHWRQRFSKESVEKIFPKIIPDQDNAYHGKTDYYYCLSERIPEDYQLRQRLAMRRLEEALSCQQREREEVGFSMPCVFCRYVARGNRAKLIHHLYMIHHLNLGSPDNLVFVHEYIEHLREKLQRNECIYCEKTFSDRNVLMDHMRKRNHREVNPKNNYYDKFYIINYLELGKRWLDVLAEDFEDTMPSFQDSDDEEEDLEWHEWQEDNTDEDQLRVVCLFCDDSYDKVQGLLTHLNDAHKFDLIGYIESEKLDVYGRMKLLNHIRKEIFNTPNYRAKVQKAEGVVEIPDRSIWDVEENLVPMFGNDHFLWMLESYLEENRKDLAGHEVEIDSDAPVATKLIEESKANTVSTVVPEDLPPLTEEASSEEFKELIKTIRSGNSVSFD
uniref:C2H2-type domain-containing protein n=1 Tax=Panagrolaimus sp. JU765 TaxID=591449 RepID=A0AC34R469_9BILA